MSESPDYKYPSVMLIDDNDLDNYVHERLITRTRFAAHVHNHASALSAIDNINEMNKAREDSLEIYPRVIFIDINMPEMNGFEFIEYLENNASENLMRPKLVILTSSVNQKDKLLALEASENVMFLNKPLTAEMLESI